MIISSYETTWEFLFMVIAEFIWYISLNALSVLFMAIIVILLVLKTLNKELENTLAHIKETLNNRNATKAITVQKCCIYSDEIAKLARIHMEISQISKELNHLFQLQILMSLTGKFATLLCSIFGTYMNTLHPMEGENSSYRTFYIFTTTLDVFLVMYVADMATEEDKRTTTILNKTMLVKDKILHDSDKYHDTQQIVSRISELKLTANIGPAYPHRITLIPYCAILIAIKSLPYPPSLQYTCTLASSELGLEDEVKV
ncbi:unnamed protein product [Hermetia illucens]|uniref:Gustatory receptor n=1 Tax=Hermetia illucens TaxID=343691 RepID=A0A7R8UQW0_HERIL|nr:unnamed protein product [Hermetia illucens]